jgi:hypothetical protein
MAVRPRKVWQAAEQNRALRMLAGSTLGLAGRANTLVCAT